MTTPSSYANAELVSTGARLGLVYQLCQITTAGGAYYNNITEAQIFHRLPSRRNIDGTVVPWPIFVIAPAPTNSRSAATNTTYKAKDFDILAITQTVPEIEGFEDYDLWVERMVADVESRISNNFGLPRADGHPTCFLSEVIQDFPMPKLKDESYSGYAAVVIRVRTILQQALNDPSVQV